MTESTIIYRGVACFSFKLLDERARKSKGSAFLAFKRADPSLREGSDYFYLPAEQEHARIEQLRRQGLIYRSTHNLVLVTDAGRRRLGWP